MNMKLVEGEFTGKAFHWSKIVTGWIMVPGKIWR